MASSPKNIVILGSGKFDGEYPSTIFTLARLFAKEHKVLYVEYPFTINDCVSLRNTEQYKVRKPHFTWNATGIIKTDLPNLDILITPPVLSINFLPEGALYRKILKINESIIANRIRKVLKMRGIEDFVYINSFNFHYPGIAQLIKPKLTVYHSVDPIIVPYDMKHGYVSEKQLLEESNLVICTSKHLFEVNKKHNKKTFFIPNAADVSHSQKALAEDLIIHPSIKEIKKPIIGYVGNIERRIDFDLLKPAIEKNPDKSFVFVGPVDETFLPQWFVNSDNVHMVGKVPYQDLPSIYKGIDVALIPFKTDEVSATIFPLKLFEYLGAGKPVVASNFNPDLESWTEGTVAYCPDTDSFEQAIKEAINTETVVKVEKRLAVAAKNTWDKRAQDFLSLLDINYN
ncbi:glycosyltransferase [Pedobacter sp. SYSU D00535]|uniref:glycosyltransferase n=1 Tax=Pedobacter sp. SYSU D00535 TaxID=2810308 RepID=UPI001A96DC5D|nr:glycosyltransferase [Pedobacter sp. SYSU D00535]